MAVAEFNTRKYGELLTEALPGIIESDAENDRAVETINRLMNKGEDRLSPEETRLFRLLVRLVEDFEARNYPMPAMATPADAVRELMSMHDLKQADMADIFGSQSVVSEILHGKRSVSKTQAKRLSQRFQIPIELFI